jgi:hypothetical protein
MSVRAFKYVTIGTTNTAQPLIGTTLTAAVNPPGPTASQIAVSDQLTTLPVADSSFFLNGDWVMLDVGANEERVIIQTVPDGTHIQVKGMAKAHANGTFVRLAVLTNDLYIQPKDGNTASLYVGTSSALTNAGAFAIKQLTKVTAGTQPNDFYINRGTGLGNPEDLGQYWIVGTNPDQYLASFWQQ